jgi:hypothetical protein
MKKLPAILVIALAACLVAAAQDSSPTTPAAAPSASQADKQSNAASATQDNSAISGDQVTKPAGAKSSTVTGCLSSPDSDGHFVLRSMQYRSGVEVVGPNDLETAAGKKVKLTGEWVAVPESQKADTGSQDAAGKKASRRFQATSFDVLDEKCPPPAETTPISKKKQKQKAAAANQNYPQ